MVKIHRICVLFFGKKKYETKLKTTFSGRRKPPKTNMKMGKQPFEDVTPMKNGDFQLLRSSKITFYGFSLGVISSPSKKKTGGRNVGQKSGLKKWNYTD